MKPYAFFVFGNGHSITVFELPPAYDARFDPEVYLRGCSVPKIDGKC